ncbi:MAG TPA: 1,4-dihydroxy-2-naphthoate octaprenyltransferase [Steroidobacteraceae bacterium]|nr:1,4-dihydroxy-2-naphthoate octaprenyltransferase [Steroidobacteraceae bacterium]
MSIRKSIRPAEPNPQAFGGVSVGARLKRLFSATRPAFFPASVAPVIVGSAWGYHEARQFDWLAFLLGLAATVCVHFASNVLNDVSDDASGTDRINEDRIYPYTGGSRFIQNGVLSSREMTVWGITLLVAAALLGLALIEIRGPYVLVFGVIGVALGVLYSLPAVQLSARGVGEAAIAGAFGVLPVCGAAWLQSGRVDWASLLISVPVSMWVAAILLMNEVPDRDADAKAGKRTLVVRLGTDATRRLYFSLHLTACIAFMLAAVLALVPWWMGMLSAALLGGAWSAARGIREPFDRPRLTRSIEMTLRLHTVGSLLLLVAVLIPR